jgi:hypothetical protein
VLLARSRSYHCSICYPRSSQDKDHKDREYRRIVFVLQKKARYKKRFKRVMEYLNERDKRITMRAFERVNPKPKYRVKAVIQVVT